MVPDEVIDKYAEQEHYYTSFCLELEGFIPVTKPITPTYEKITTEEGIEKSVQVSNSALSSSILKRYYNSLIHNVNIPKRFLLLIRFYNFVNALKNSKLNEFQIFCADNFEIYLSDLLYEIYLANPSTLKSHQQVTIKEVLDCADMQEFVLY